MATKKIANGLRADARRNRERIVSAAGRLFAAQGVDIPMEEIARGAEVGVGTLYRRFASREELLAAVVAELNRCLLAAMSDVSARESENWRRLRGVLHGWLELPLCGLISVVLADSRAECECWFGPFRELVRGAQSDGALRPDIEPAEISVMVSLLARGTGDGTATRQRLLAVMLAGLSADRPAQPV
jgi:AcrR family transcriptional regulator